MCSRPVSDDAACPEKPSLAVIKGVGQVKRIPYFSVGHPFHFSESRISQFRTPEASTAAGTLCGLLRWAPASSRAWSNRRNISTSYQRFPLDLLPLLRIWLALLQRRELPQDIGPEPLEVEVRPGDADLGLTQRVAGIRIAV